MKKLISLTLALVLAMSLSVTAFASSVEHGPESNTYTQTSDNINIEANYSTKADETVHTYKVKIDWTAPTFSYEFDGKTYTWNTTDMKYDVATLPGAGWGENTTGALTLKVTNYSDMAVDCAATLTDDVDDGVTVRWTGASGTANAAVTIDSGKTAADYTNAGVGAATNCNLSGTITVSGTPNNDTLTTIAKVTVTVSAASSGS